MKNVNVHLSLSTALIRGDLETVKYIIMEQKWNINDATFLSEKMTALAMAARCGRRNVAEFLLDAGADVNLGDNQGQTPLHVACFRGHTELVRLLLSHGADPNAKDKGGRTPLHQAYKNDVPEISGLLVEAGADVNALTDAGKTPLGLACYHGHTGILLFHLANNIYVTEDDVNTLLNLAVNGLQTNDPAREKILDWFKENRSEEYFTKFCTTNMRI